MAKAKPADVPFAPPNWPAAKTEMWKLARIKPYPNNARTHPASQITLLASLMKKRGVDQPIVVDEAGVILKGHGRLAAAIEAGFEEFPVAIHRGLSEADKRAMRIEDNQVALLSGWDDALLRLEISDLKLDNYDVALLGFEPGFLNAVFLDYKNGETNPTMEWDGMPAFDQQNKFGVQRIVVHFQDKASVEKFASLLNVKVSDDTRFIWYPELKPEVSADKRFKS